MQRKSGGHFRSIESLEMPRETGNNDGVQR